MEEASKPVRKRAKFIEDCDQARGRGLYQFLRHLTQGFRWDSTEWCGNCLLDGWAQRKLAQRIDEQDQTLYQRMLDESRPEVQAFLDHSRTIRERNAAKRAAANPPPVKVAAATTQPEVERVRRIPLPATPKPTPTPPPVAEPATPTAAPSEPRRERSMVVRDEETKKKQPREKWEEKERKPEEKPVEPKPENNAFAAGKAVVGGLFRWIATGKLQ